MDNKIGAILSADDYNAVMDAIQTIRERMPFLVGMSVAQRRGIARMGDMGVSFVNRCAEVASQYQSILPRNLDVAEVQKDVQLFNQLHNIFTALSQVMEMVGDTMTQAGAEAFTAALIVYDSAKRNQSTYGLESIVKDLTQRFPRRKSKSSSDSQTASSTAPATEPASP